MIQKIRDYFIIIKLKLGWREFHFNTLYKSTISVLPPRNVINRLHSYPDNTGGYLPPERWPKSIDCSSLSLSLCFIIFVPVFRQQQIS